MKLIIAACLVACACADVSHILAARDSEKRANIIKQELDDSPDGYQWLFETENGIRSAAKGNIVQTDAENVALRVEGEASWTSPEGVPLVLQYIADENGYRPQGSHLPTPPPIPGAILRSLEYIRSHLSAVEK